MGKGFHWAAVQYALMNKKRKERKSYIIASFFWRNWVCRAKCKQKPNSVQSECDCTVEAAPPFQEMDLTKKFVRFSRAYRNEQKSYKKCLFEEDVRRGLLSGKSFQLIESFFHRILHHESFSVTRKQIIAITFIEIIFLQFYDWHFNGFLDSFFILSSGPKFCFIFRPT